MTPAPFDCLIVGQGLAGTTLAWQALAVGLRVAVVDRGDTATASRVAAGLMTPVTGKRVVKSWRFDEFLPVATAFYRRIEAELSIGIYQTTPMVRLFASDRERAVYEARAAVEFQGLTRSPNPTLDPTRFAGSLDGFEMPSAGRLDVTAYLDASREAFRSRGLVRSATLEPNGLVPEPNLVHVPKLGLTANRVVFCTGYDTTLPWFRSLPFNAAKGEILTLRIPGFTERRVVNRGIWIAPAGEDHFRAGATYEWDDLTPTPTAAGREKLEARLRTLLKIPYEVVGHRAGVRPISADRNPILGFHPALPRIGLFTGLGSKGVLLAPYFAGQLATALLGRGFPDPVVDLRRWVPA